MSLKTRIFKKFEKLLYGNVSISHMTRMPRKFIWIGEEGHHGTHLHLKYGREYPSSSVSTSMLVEWLKDKKIKFIEDVTGEPLLEDVTLEVQKGTIPLSDLFAKLNKIDIREK